MVAQRSYLESGTGCRWLMPTAEMAGLASGRWRPSPDPALAGWACSPRFATRALGPDPGSVRAARDFTVAILRRRGIAERGPNIAIVVSELLTNALRHALPGPGDTRAGRPVRLGLLQPGPCVLCAVADPGTAAPAPRTPGSPRRDRPGTAPHRRAQRPVGLHQPPAILARSCGPCSVRGRHRRPRPGTHASQAATRRGTRQPGRVSQREPLVAGQPRKKLRALACYLVPRSRVDDYLVPVWSRSVPDLPAARRGTRICAGNWQAGPPGSLRASHRHPGHLHGLSTSLCIPPYTADLARAGVIGACSYASPGSHEVSRTGLPRLDRVAPSHQGSREPLRTATNLAAGPARPAHQPP
jgi:Histidine kinase-like ATPase domain